MVTQCLIQHAVAENPVNTTSSRHSTQDVLDSRCVQLAPHVPILVWATDQRLVDALHEYLLEPARALRVLEDDGQLAASGSNGALLVAQVGPRLEAQQAFLRGPLILVDPTRSASGELRARAYAIVGNAAEAGLAVDRFLTHRQAAERVARHRGSPRRCSRCGRGFDALKASRGGTATRFVRFGSISLCGGCVEKLRSLLRQTETTVVEADA
jgi:hypothetical protein